MRPIAKRSGAGRAWAVAVMAAVGLATIAAVAGPASGQVQRAAFPDDSVIAKDALVRASELATGGNPTEAVRVLQSLLDNEGDKVVASEEDPLLHLSVRDRAMTLLLKTEGLLDRYRAQETPKAAEMLAAGRLADLEQTRLLTAPGFEAALRLAQLEIEAARFESARLLLAQLEDHPERKAGNGARDAALLAADVSRYLPRPRVRAWAERWMDEAGLKDELPPPVAAPELARVEVRSPLDAGPGLGPDALPAMPLSTSVYGVDDELGLAPLPDVDIDQFERVPWRFPTVAGGVVYTNDGERVSALDGLTLSLLWRVRPSGQSPQRYAFDDFVPLLPLGARGRDDAATVSVAGRVAVAIMGKPNSGQRTGPDTRIHGLETQTGRVLWSVDLRWLDPQRLGDAVLRGPAVIDGDTVVLAARRPRNMRRFTELYLVGLDLSTGERRWMRMVASMGSAPWGRSPSRPDATLLHEGIVYRGDEMGVIGAYEATRGRPVWVRLLPNARPFDAGYRSPESPPPAELHRPLVVGDDMLFLDPVSPRMLRIGLADGAVKQELEAGALGEPRYLLLAGDKVAAVGRNRVVTLGQNLDLKESKMSPIFPAPGIVGRVAVAGKDLLVPVQGGMVLLNAADPSEGKIVTLDRTGHLLTFGGDGKAHLLASDDAGLHAFLTWETAERALAERIEKTPGDAEPLLTMLRLAARAGKVDMAPALADRALRVLDGAPTSARSIEGRRRLFGLLSALVGPSIAAWDAPRELPPEPQDPEMGVLPEGEPAAAPGLAPPITDLALLDALVERMGRAAESPSERTEHTFRLAWVREKQGNDRAAVEALQRILTDADLAASPFAAGLSGQEEDLPPGLDPQLGGSAAAEATRRLFAALERAGPQAYALFDEEAAARLSAMPQAASAAELMGLARQYPAAMTTPDAWRRASAALAASGRRHEARRAAGLGLGAVRLGTLVGRRDQSRQAGELAGQMLALLADGDAGEAEYRALRMLAPAHPGATVSVGGTEVTLSAAADSMRARLTTRTSAPAVGTVFAREAQGLEFWRPITPLLPDLAGDSRDSVVMSSDRAKEVALWAVSPFDRRLSKVWSRPSEFPPRVVRVSVDHTVLLWAGPGRVVVECVSSADGTTVWMTRDLAGAFMPPPSDPSGRIDRIPTPLDGQVRVTDIVAAGDAQTLVLAQRSGHALALSMADGTLLWSNRLELTRVYDLECEGGVVAAGGAIGRNEQGNNTLTPAVLFLNVRDGTQRTRIAGEALGEHVRWVMLHGDDAIIGTASGVMRVGSQNGAIRWKAVESSAQLSLLGRVVGQNLFVLGQDLSLWTHALTDGRRSAEPCDTRNRIAFPLSVHTWDGALAFTSGQGLVVLDAQGRLAGADGLELRGGVTGWARGDGCFVAMEASPEPIMTGPDAGMATARVFVASAATGRLLAADRVTLPESPEFVTLLDGKVIVTCGAATLVLDAPR